MNTDLRVAVCTNRSPDEVGEALGALRAQVDGEALVVIASGRHDPEFLSEPRPGLSHARNRALAWAAEVGADVLAFVDDDAVVDPGWYDALRTRWDEAPSEVACIGGPIRPRYSVPPPAWFSDGIAHVLTVLARGPDVRDLDPDVEAVYGANISFRVEPLRGAGGFDPALGHAGSRTFFGEEDEAQRALVRLGYRVRYVPDAGVTHVIPADRLTRASFLRRRYAFGAALGMRGGRGRSLAARQAMASGAGAITAAASAHQALAMERAVRAAENLGVLLARR
ncbi:MAG: glucosyl-dolichyl phosphate glucuronosyltransferase [Thermoleophilaceae bacterium]|nr:glucosyl-dolichyl phosphate glucuronosyltransferase [Thermoleophilaceae bacterium]